MSNLLTGYTRGHEAGDVARYHSPDHDLYDVFPPGRCHSTKRPYHDAYRTDVGKPTQAVGGYDDRSVLKIK